MGSRGRGRPAEVTEAPTDSAPTDSAPTDSAPTVRGRAERRKTARRAARRKRRSLVREVPMIAAVALLIALLLKTFALQVFVIPSGSMEETIRIGDRVLVDKLTPWFGSTPQRGEVVVFKDPGGWLDADHRPSTDGAVLHGVKQVFSYVGLLPSTSEQDLIKRVIGLPGDTVECCDAQGKLRVNGVAIDEPYLAPGNVPSKQPFKITVPAGRLWVMGDHRDVSADSRYHMGNPGGGTIPMDSVVGRAFMIAWPLPHLRQLDAPASLHSAAQSAGVRPDLWEPPLVMGVLGVIPLLRRVGARAPMARSDRSAEVLGVRTQQ